MSMLLGSILAFAAVVTAVRSWRLSCWVPIEAELVHFDLVGPLGLGSSRLAEQLELQRRGQGAMGPEVVYHAELIYVVEGVPYHAELTFDGPPDRRFPLRFNPNDPTEHTERQPDYSQSVGLASLAAAAFAYSFG